MVIIRAVWCQRKTVIAERLAAATHAPARGRRVQAVSGPCSSSARPVWARPKATAASVGGLRLDTGSPGTPTMLAG